MDVYENAEDFEITQKGDESPLTKADIAAHEVIVAVSYTHLTLPTNREV